MSKIVILGTSHPFRGGLASYNERLAKEFIALGHEVIIYTFSLQYPSILFPGKSQYTDQKAPDNLDIRVKVNSINPLNWIKIGYEIKKLNADLLITKFWIPFMGPSLGTICRIARKNFQTKVICILDNVIPHEKRLGDSQLIKYFIGSIDAAIAMSDSVLNDFKKFDSKKPITLSPHPIFDNFGKEISKDDAQISLGLEKNVKYILFFGFIRDYKGLDILLKAMADDRIRSLGIKAIIAGEYYSDSKPYLDLISDLKISASIILHTDFINDDFVKNYFCAADIIVQPYKHATQSGVTQICYHFNKPMIVTNVGGLSEIVPDQKVGYVCEVDPKSIANALVDFYMNKREEEFITNLIEEKKKYSWNKMVNTILDLKNNSL